MPRFYGDYDPREYTEWEIEVEQKLDKYYSQIPDDSWVSTIVREFREYAYEWWLKLVERIKLREIRYV